MNRGRSSATAALTILALTSTASVAQTSTTFMSSNSDWTSATGCHITQGQLVLPGGVVYYTPSTYPAAGPAMLGICGSFDSNVPPTTIGWSNQPSFPYFGTGTSGAGGVIDQFIPQNDQGADDQGDDDQGYSTNQPPYQPTNDGPPSTSENPQNTAPVTTSTPEPSSVILLGSGLAALAVRETRRRKRTTSSEQ